MDALTFLIIILGVPSLPLLTLALLGMGYYLGKSASTTEPNSNIHEPVCCLCGITYPPGDSPADNHFRSLWVELVFADQRETLYACTSEHLERFFMQGESHGEA